MGEKERSNIRKRRRKNRNNERCIDLPMSSLISGSPDIRSGFSTPSLPGSQPARCFASRFDGISGLATPGFRELSPKLSGRASSNHKASCRCKGLVVRNYCPAKKRKKPRRHRRKCFEIFDPLRRVNLVAVGRRLPPSLHNPHRRNASREGMWTTYIRSEKTGQPRLLL